MKYEIFDTFLRVETWHTSHPLDDKRFFRCLHEVVENPAFSAEAMGDYMRDVKSVNSHEHHYASRIRDLVSKASAVREYLQVTERGLPYDDPNVRV
ncbi:hypothetical protein [Bradyrhizobium sp. Ash2021]|uniref:hypothetical protein n=1 Tax=Bradyrhizobium sp. Ash2021 TaxID=2954771 RepID=UPI0028158C23|nr:hypothetical protein [Bradyrhizobium sp. Ash2021]WMT71137.1 hypothetical protein NL528_23850 [Bradyrhizobium sp. Ash2021]